MCVLSSAIIPKTHVTVIIKFKKKNETRCDKKFRKIKIFIIFFLYKLESAKYCIYNLGQEPIMNNVKIWKLYSAKLKMQWFIFFQSQICQLWYPFWKKALWIWQLTNFLSKLARFCINRLKQHKTRIYFLGRKKSIVIAYYKALHYMQILYVLVDISFSNKKIQFVLHTALLRFSLHISAICPQQLIRHIKKFCQILFYYNDELKYWK